MARTESESKQVTHITAFESEVSVVVPESDEIVIAKVESDVTSGLTITLPPGTPMWKLHSQILAGNILEVGFFYKPAEKAS